MQDLSDELLKAIKEKDLQRAQFYLETLGDADINKIVDKDGNSLLHLAIIHDMPQLFDELIKKNIDIYRGNKRGDTPLDLCNNLSKPSQYLATITSAGSKADSKADQKFTEEDKKAKEMLFTHRGATGIMSTASALSRELVGSSAPSGPEPLKLVDSLLSGMSRCLVNECDCCPQLARRPGKKSLRDDIDEATTRLVNEQFPASKSSGPIVLMCLGSGKYKQLATTAASLMRSGRDVELILIDHEIGKQPETNRQFQEILEKMEKEYGKKVSIIGQFSSLEVYKSIMKGTKPPVVLRHGEISTRPEDKAMSEAFQVEFESYKNKCQKVPHVVTVIDDVTTLGGAYGPITDYSLFSNDEWRRLKDYRMLCYREDVVKEIERIAYQKPTAGPDKTLYVTTEKSEGYGNTYSVKLDVTAVKAKNYEPGEMEMGVRKPSQQLDQTVLYTSTMTVKNEEREVFEQEKKEKREAAAGKSYKK